MCKLFAWQVLFYGFRARKWAVKPEKDKSCVRKVLLWKDLRFFLLGDPFPRPVRYTFGNRDWTFGRRPELLGRAGQFVPRGLFPKGQK